MTGERFDLEPAVRVPFRWAAFLAKQRVLARRKGILFPLPSMGLHLSIWALGQLGWALDAALYPKPSLDFVLPSMFIVGHQRSGTTFLHRLLARDARAHSMVLHEMLLPATSIQNTLARAKRIDAHFGSHCRTWFEALQDRKLGHLDDIHRVRFDEPEEDEIVMWATFASDICINDTPALIEMQDEDMPEPFQSWDLKEQLRALIWYRACVRKKLQRAGAQGWYLGKNPRFARCLPQLNQVFPESRIILMIRNPIETIVSRMSMLQALWRYKVPDLNHISTAQVNWILKDSIETYLKTEEGIASLPDERILIVGYQDLIRSPRFVVDRITDHFGLPSPSEELVQALNKLEHKQHRSKHKYDLLQFGLKEEQIKGPLSGIFDKYKDLFVKAAT
ncbi:MAG: hypothetical protein CMK59_09760 [Proteobacteria bacterium]|nr:hypothetical protein [Pseudomonadota bacterium]